MILDIDNNPISQYIGKIAPLEVKEASIQVDCKTGQYLYSEVTVDFVVEAKRAIDSTWIAIETTPIDLNAYDGQRVLFNIQITAGAELKPSKRYRFRLKVGIL